MYKYLLKIVLFWLIPLSAIASQINSSYPQTTQKGTSMSNTNLPDGLYAEIKTNLGTMVVELEHEKAPLTVANFVGLVEGTKKSNKAEGTPYYDGIVFHRVIESFMIQGGDPEGTGMGGPGYQFADEFHPTLRHSSKGILSMANAGPGTNGSQFFITQVPTPHLDDRHTVFGKVVEGIDVIDVIASVPKGAGDRPTEDVVMEKVTILRIGSDAKAFKGDEAHFQELQAGAEARKEAAADEAAQIAAMAVEAFVADLVAKHGEVQKTESGIQYVILEEGTGEVPKQGDNVRVHYTGTFIDGQKFDSSIDRGQPIEFSVGKGMVIPGWDETLLAMKAGEKRIVVLPPEKAYGEQGVGPIPPNSTLVFEMELLP
jgi:cyclophilin family peptidyl-prolyl cis-trans isomerase